MPSTALISRLKSDYRQFSFKKSVRFLWSPNEQTIYYNSSNENNPIFLLHELSHALLSHDNYNYDIELVTMEREAWDKVKQLGKKYDVEIKEDIIQSTLDSYREWLHERSTCPNCNATGIQTKKQNYKCLACEHEWRVNDAKLCALRRYKK